MARKPTRGRTAAPRSAKSLRARLEEERDAVRARLRQLRASGDLEDGAAGGGNESALDEGDAARVSESRDVSFATRERLTRRLGQLTAALERLERDDYGRCTVCGEPIEPERLVAIPEAATCLGCQERQERRGRTESVV